MQGLRLVPEETNFNFIGLRFLAYMVSAVLVFGSIALTVQRGLNFGIDFTGGTVIEIRTPEAPDLAELRALLNDLDLGAITLQEFGSPEDLLIRLPEQKGGVEAQQMAIEDVREALDDIYADAGEVDYRRTEFVGPQVGEELKKQGLLAVLFSLAGILAYVWFRFEWQFGVASIIALAHDAIATIGLFALTQMEFNLSTVAAILMIAGYSINDTVIVFDRIRENLRKFKKMSLPELFNKSVNEMLGRTLMTSGTTLLALIALYIFGGEVIQGFIYALIFGIVVGTYSSVFVAAPVLLNTGVKRGEVQSGDTTPQKA
ncbi:MAG TPA: protein translocase subunit SecF [Alphaproteobacteria bacterium]|nr:protein translocase subunit SecF [Alphaproteobacteria bacterium]USO05969.1 MAG: protein translocase subunit SecF [Rhodospirillales bacterium]HOO81170.1 protein translocase subunit SecF [Alphaproteobacteria bacterium]